MHVFLLKDFDTTLTSYSFSFKSSDKPRKNRLCNISITYKCNCYTSGNFFNSRDYKTVRRKSDRLRSHPVRFLSRLINFVQSFNKFFFLSTQRHTRGRSKHILLDTFHIHSGWCIYEEEGIGSSISWCSKFKRWRCNDKTHKILSMGCIHIILSGELLFELFF